MVFVAKSMTKKENKKEEGLSNNLADV